MVLGGTAEPEVALSREGTALGWSSHSLSQEDVCPTWIVLPLEKLTWTPDVLHGLANRIWDRKVLRTT